MVVALLVVSLFTYSRRVFLARYRIVVLHLRCFCYYVCSTFVTYSQLITSRLRVKTATSNARSHVLGKAGARWSRRLFCACQRVIQETLIRQLEDWPVFGTLTAPVVHAGGRYDRMRNPQRHLFQSGAIFERLGYGGRAQRIQTEASDVAANDAPPLLCHHRGQQPQGMQRRQRPPDAAVRNGFCFLCRERPDVVYCGVRTVRSGALRATRRGTARAVVQQRGEDRTITQAF